MLIEGGPFAGLNKNYYRAVIADPPWHFTTWSAKGKGRSPRYPTQLLAWLINLPVEDLVAKDCALFLWANAPLLPMASAVMAAWGFTYKTVAFTWVKQGPFGMGYWTRAGSEICLLGTRGKPKRKHADVAQVVTAPRREHSRKPDETLGRVMRLVRGPYLELFARERRLGWTSWGNDVEKFRKK